MSNPGIFTAQDDRNRRNAAKSRARRVHLRSCIHNRWRNSNQTDRVYKTLGSLASLCSSQRSIKARQTLDREAWDQLFSPSLAMVCSPLSSLPFFNFFIFFFPGRKNSPEFLHSILSTQHHAGWKLGGSLNPLPSVHCTFQGSNCSHDMGVIPFSLPLTG